MTFTALVKLADFSSPPPAAKIDQNQGDVKDETGSEADSHAPVKLGGLVYNIQLALPESRDPAVYDALFQSLRRHLL